MSSVRHDWYQTDQKVVIDVLVKNANNRNCSVDIQSNHVSVHGDDLILELDLEHEIDAAKSTFRILTVKIEITLHKLVGERWSSLTKTAATAAAAAQVKTLPPMASVPPMASEQSSSPTKKNDKNWDRVVKDAWDKEEIEKDEAKQLNSLFEKIYSESNPDVRRAMNKSFVESGGTVLSTNWQEVSSQTVDVKPPTGTEFRPWDE